MAFPFQRLRHLFRRKRFEADMAEELQAHLEMQAAANRAAGMDADEARYAARRQFGGLDQIKEIARAQRAGVWLEQLLQDVRYATRALRKNPGFTAVVVLTLALGIGLNTVAFSFYHTLVGKPLPVRSPGEILRVSADGRRFQSPFSHDEYVDLQARLQSAAAVIATSPLQVLLTTSAAAGGRAAPAAVQLVSENYFTVLGVPAVLGRTFDAGADEEAVLSFDAWQRRFNGDRNVIGRTVRLQDLPVTIVGVAPPSFGGTTPPSAPDFWLPMAAQPRLLPNVDWLHDPATRAWQLLVRRRAEFTPDQVGAEIQVVARTWRQPDGQPLRTGVQTATFFQLGGPEVNAVFVTLLLAVGLILLVGGINVVNLLFARNAVREHELAIRLALGASRGRLLRQLCTESMLLGLLGGAGGLLLAWWACGGIETWQTTFMREITRGTWSPFLDLTPDALVFAYTLAIALGAGLLVGLRPAWHGTRVNVEAALKQKSSEAASGISGRRNYLLAVQVAASLLLLAGAGLLLRGASRALTTDPGFDAPHLLAVVAWSNLQTAAPNAADQARRAREIDARLRSVPGVVSVSGADRVPFSGHSISTFVTDENRWVNGCVTMHVDRDYFSTLGLRLVSGRPFTAAETAQAAPVVIITQSAARHLWPGKDPLGRSLHSPQRGPAGEPGTSYTVIGVAQDARFTLLSRVDDVDLFFPQAATAGWMVRTRGAPEAVVPSIYAALKEIDPLLESQSAVWTMEAGPMRVQWLMAEAPANIASLLGGIALALAAVGIFGVVSYGVARRTREFGIRLALGAQKRDVIALVLRQTLRPVAWGVAFGLAGAVAVSVLLTRLVLNAEMPDLTYGAGAFPVATFAGALGVLLAVIALAAWLPARRAAKVDPVVALRAE